ncbi:MAG: hypothetical protein NVS9B12_15240 [Vulcanimicrobiaceae bacterium]
MKFLYDLLAGNSRITPFGVLAAALLASALVRAQLTSLAAGVFVAVLLATLAAGVLEKER